MSNTPFVCKKHIKKWALEYAKANRAWPFRAVSDGFVIACDIDVRNFIIDRIKRHPSKGVTLR